MKNKIVAMALIVFIVSSLSAATDNADGYIRSSVYELESQLSRNLESQISQFVGVENLWVSLHLSVDHFSLRKEMAKNSPESKKRQKQKFDDLPGLNISPEGIVVKGVEDDKTLVIDSSKFSVEPTLLLTHTESVQIVLYHKNQLDKKIERLIRSLIEDKMSPLKVAVQVEFNHRKAKALDQANLDEGKKIRFEPESFAKSFHEAALSTQDFLNDKILGPLKVGFAAALFIFLATMGLMFHLGIKALNSINRTLAALVSANGQMPATAHFEDSNHLTGTVNEELKTSGTADSDPRDKIIEIHQNYGEIITNFFDNAMDKKEFRDIWCLSQILGDKIFFKNSSLTKNKNFKLYAKFLNNNLYAESSFEDYKRIYQQLMSLMLYPQVFFINSIRVSLNAIPLQALGVCFDEFNEIEKAITLEAMDPIRMASLVNSGYLHAAGISQLDSVEFELNSLLKFDKKAHELRTRFEAEESHDRLSSTLKYLSHEQFDDFVISKGLDEKFTVAKLYQENEQLASEFFKDLSIEEICSLLPMLREEFGQDICNALPDIKRARVQSARKVMSRMSFETMAKFHAVLWTAEFKEELKVKSSPPSFKVAA